MMIRKLKTVFRKLLFEFSFRSDFNKFSELAARTEQRFELKWVDRFPCLHQKAPKTYFDTHYVYHTSWAARCLARIKPDYHIDIASSLHFATIVSAFVPIKFFDYRPADINLDNLAMDFADLLSLPFEDNSIHSLSCMHVVEHVGLGRYGDQIDPDGDLKAISELKRVIADGGSLLFVVPVGKPRILFNAHRIYSYDQVVQYFSDFKLEHFSLIPDIDKMTRGMIVNADRNTVNTQSYGCGCFWFIK